MKNQYMAFVLRMKFLLTLITVCQVGEGAAAGGAGAAERTDVARYSSIVYPRLHSIQAPVFDAGEAVGEALEEEAFTSRVSHYMNRRPASLAKLDHETSPEEKLTLDPCLRLHSDSIAGLLNGSINTAVGAFSMELNIRGTGRRRYDFYVFAQECDFSPLLDAGPMDGKSMNVLSYYKVANTPFNGRIGKEAVNPMPFTVTGITNFSEILETMAAEPHSKDDGKVTKTATNTLQLSVTGGYPAAAAVGGNFSVALGTSVDITNINMYSHIGSESNPCVTSWEYRFNNLGTAIAPHALFSPKQFWIWRIDHLLAIDNGIYVPSERARAVDDAEVTIRNGREDGARALQAALQNLMAPTPPASPAVVVSPALAAVAGDAGGGVGGVSAAVAAATPAQPLVLAETGVPPALPAVVTSPALAPAEASAPAQPLVLAAPGVLPASPAVVVSPALAAAAGNAGAGVPLAQPAQPPHPHVRRGSAPLMIGKNGDIQHEEDRARRLAKVQAGTIVKTRKEAVRDAAEHLRTATDGADFRKAQAQLEAANKELGDAEAAEKIASKGTPVGAGAGARAGYATLDDAFGAGASAGVGGVAHVASGRTSGSVAAMSPAQTNNYMFPFMTTFDIASRTVTQRNSCATCFGYAKWNEGTVVPHNNALESYSFVKVPDKPAGTHTMGTFTLLINGEIKVKWDALEGGGSGKDKDKK